MDSKADFFAVERITSLERYGGSTDFNVRKTARWEAMRLLKSDHWRPDPGGFAMTYSPFVSKLSVVMAYIAFAFVGAIVLGVF